MGKKDASMKALLSKNEVFADACNQYFFHGEKVVKPESLKELDPTEIVLPFGKEEKEAVANQKYRDILKLCTIKTDAKYTYCIFGIESQSNVHYAMPVRNFLYDAMQLTKQVSEIVRKHKEQRKSKVKTKEEISSDEYLSGFYKTDKLIPVLTLVVYLGTDAWDGPTSLREMYTETDEIVLQHVADYKMNLLDLTHCDDEEIARFCNDLFQVTTFVKYSESIKEFWESVVKKERFSHVSREAIDVVQSFTNYRFKVEEGKEDEDMCQALTDLIEEGRAEGRVEGLEQGLQQATQTILQKFLDAGMDEKEMQRMLSVTPEEFDKMLQREPVEA
ncbi:MAG: Rpn family recombination-promoting nuclease/putative transposase [Lachnospiraceae bacterium]|nr:Rpn family recombination-promoting nuclease/putative transposase [Lachnospiraceae bacterium]